MRHALPRLLTALAACSVLAGPAWAADGTAGDGIVLSNSYAGNSWRQEMIKTWDEASGKAVSDHVIAKAAVVNANNSAPQQETQIETMILQGWKAIVIDAASTTALNGVIAEACKAGVKVVVFDSLATAPCATKVAYDYEAMGRMQVDFVAKALGGKGNVLQVRGIAGTSVDTDTNRGVVEEMRKYPDLKLVGTVYGNWTQSIAQKAVAGVLPTLPPVAAVVTEGGDGYGTYQAFHDAGRPTPLIMMGNRQEELALWHTLSAQPGGYHTMSVSSAPGCATIAMWVAQQLLAGAKVPDTVEVPLLVIQQDDLDAWLKATPAGGVATSVYDQDWTRRLIAADAGHTAPPPSPIPAPLVH